MLKGRNVLLTGATGGIGRELTPLLLNSGANLFVTGRDGAKLKELVEATGMDDRQALEADLTREEDVNRLHQAFFTNRAHIDVLIVTSGKGIIKPMDLLSPEEFQHTLQINLVAPFLLMKAFLPSMKERKSGLVINVPGVLGKVPMAGAAAYCASKYGLVGMMQSIREEVKRTDIRITNLFLGGTDSPFWDSIDLRVQREKMVTAAEAAKAIWFLCQQPVSGVVSEMVLQPFNHQAI